MPQLTMPNIGEGVAEGTVTRWLKREGDDVALDEPVVEVETDKAVVEIPSPYAGKLTKIIVPEGAIVPIGSPLAEFTGTGATAAPPIAAHADEKEARQPEPRSARRDSRDGPSAATTLTSSKADGASVPSEFRRTRQYSPVVLKLAADHGIDLVLVRGTGINGRVTRQDAMRYLENPALNTVPPASSAGVVGVDRQLQTTPAPTPPAAETGARPGRIGADDETVTLAPTRRTIASRMAESHQTIPVAWMAVEADVTSLVALRERVKDEFLHAEGVKLTYLPFFVQAIVGALKEHPDLNATFSGDGITLHRRHDIGIAVATDWGLVVPVIREADTRSIAGLARELESLGEKARARKLTLAEMRDATLTIDNTGAFGSIMSQPIVPVGQAAIITTELIRQELRPLPGASFGTRSIMNLCLSFDHRALDGAQAGAFMRDVTAHLAAYTADQSLY